VHDGRHLRTQRRGSRPSRLTVRGGEGVHIAETGHSMSGSEAHHRIMDWKLELIALPVADIDAAIAFYRDRVGINLDHDHAVNEDLRFVQLTPPGSGCSIAIGKGLMRQEQAPITTLQLVVTDIEAAHAHLTEHGVEVSEIDVMPWGSFVYFADPDGNRWAVQSIPPRA
jgi:predicted enzyme related to lactoylglutathione lyase